MNTVEQANAAGLVRVAQRELDDALDVVARLRSTRDDRIREALAAGVRQREIMDDTGLSRGRVDQIRRGTR